MKYFIFVAILFAVGRHAYRAHRRNRLNLQDLDFDARKEREGA